MKFKWSELWTRLIGSPQELTIENRAFNAISVLTFIFLLVIFPINIYLGLYKVSAIVCVLIILLGILYYYSRVHKKYSRSMAVFAVCSYLTLIANYFINSGIKGPTLYLFFLTFQLLIAFTAKKQHRIWILAHLLVTSGLLLTEYFYPELVPDSYNSHNDYFFDLISAYLLILVCMYSITIHLRSNYQRERKMVEQHTAKIAEQHDQILLKNEQLQRLNQEKNKLLSVLAHDLRAPLNSITTVLDFLSNYSVPDDQRKELQKELLDTTRNTSDMLSNLLAWSSGQIKGLQPHYERVCVSDVIGKVMQLQQGLADKKNIRVDLSLDAVYARADLNMLELTIRNVINNAIKFTDRDGCIRIKAYQEATCIISVEDTGIGMPPRQQEALFSMDIHSTYGTNNEIGIGLGLLLSKEFMEIQGGSIHLESVEGEGSTFYITIPVDTSA